MLMMIVEVGLRKVKINGISVKKILLSYHREGFFDLSNRKISNINHVHSCDRLLDFIETSKSIFRECSIEI